MKKTELKEKLRVLLTALLNDVRVNVTQEEAAYMLNRITDLIYSDYENCLNKPKIHDIEKPFLHLAYGDLEIRYFNVVNIMRCIKNTEYGIYPKLMPR